MANAPEEPGVESSEDWVCLGMRRDDKLLYQAWAALENLTDTKLYKKKLVPYAKPGGIFTMSVVRRPGDTPGVVRTSVYTAADKAPRYKGLYPDDAKTLEWATLSESEIIADRMEKKAKADLSINVLKEALEPIRQAYRKTDYTGRRAIKALVLEYLEMP